MVERDPRLNLGHAFAQKFHNKVMLSQYTKEYYILDPSKQSEETEKDFSNIVWIEFDESAAAKGANVDVLASLLSDFGDFNVFKDTHNSIYLEFFYFEPEAVPGQSVEDFIKVLTVENEGAKAKSRGIKKIVPWKVAAKFKAHNRLD